MRARILYIKIIRITFNGCAHFLIKVCSRHSTSRGSRQIMTFWWRYLQDFTLYVSNSFTV